MSVQSRKVKMTLNFKEGKPQVYKLVQVTAPAVTFGQLVDECSVSCGVNTSQTKSVLDALVNRLVHYMEIGHPVKMGEFGSFKPAFRSKTVKRVDDLDNKTITRKVVRFYPGKAFRDMLADLSIISAGTALNSPGIDGTHSGGGAGGEE